MKKETAKTKKTKETKVSTSKRQKSERKKIHKEKINLKKEKLPTFKTIDMLGLLVLTCCISLFSGYFFGNRMAMKTTTASMPTGMDKVINTFNDIKENYYKDVKDETLINGAISGMLNALGDPYAAFIDTSSNNFDVMLEGNYEGIGIEVFNNDKEEIEILTVFDNSPASRAGLKPKDIITKLNNESVKGKSTTELVNKIKKLKNAEFTLMVMRGEDEIKVTVKREQIELSSVRSKTFKEQDKTIGYMRIDIFSLSTYSQFKAQLEKLEKDKMDSLIIDVRGNSGGHLVTVSNILSLFLDKSHVIYQTQKKENIEKFYSTGKTTKTYPIVVLTDGSSASASELLAATLKEEYGATTIGKTTYGKGTVQELKDVDHNEYKFTTKKWLTPKGNWINEKGVTPDIEVDLDQAYLNNPSDETDKQLQKALEYLREK